MSRTRRPPRSTATWNIASANFLLRWLQRILTRATKRRGRRSSASSATSASAGTCGHGRGCKPEPDRALSFITRFDSSRRSRPAPCTRVGARATSPSSGMSSTTWTSRPGTGLRLIGSWLRRCPATGSTLRESGDPNGPGLPSWPAFTNAESKVEYLADPITVGGVANLNSLSVFDAVYTTVRGAPFAARATSVSKGTP